MNKYVYAFEEGKKEMKNLLGGKGANLAEMTNIGLPVPRGFTISTEACTEYYNKNETISEDILKEIFLKLEELENKTGKKKFTLSVHCGVSYIKLDNREVVRQLKTQ